MKTICLTLYTRLASYVANLDASGITPEEAEQCRKALAEHGLKPGDALDVGPAFFGRPDFPGAELEDALPGDVAEFVFHDPEDKPAPRDTVFDPHDNEERDALLDERAELRRQVDERETEAEVAREKAHELAAQVVLLRAACKQVVEWRDLIRQNYPEMVSLLKGMDDARAALAATE